MTTPTVPPFAGWFRPSRRVAWVRLVGGRDYDTTWGLLLDALSSVRGGELLVVRAADDPNARRLPGRRSLTEVRR